MAENSTRLKFRSSGPGRERAKPMIIAGADGCKGLAWYCVTLDLPSDKPAAFRAEDFADLLRQLPPPAILAIDVPIGLPEKGSRLCDPEARRLLKRPRNSSVFPSPIRPALRASTIEEASQITQEADGRRISVFAWGIFPKVKSVDDRMDRSMQQSVREIHPELCFWAWSGEQPMRHKKDTELGLRERNGLIDAWLPIHAARLRENRPSGVEKDDVNDAFAALWTAKRIAEGSARRIPACRELDAKGLSMEMWY